MSTKLKCTMFLIKNHVSWTELINAFWIKACPTNSYEFSVEIKQEQTFFV